MAAEKLQPLLPLLERTLSHRPSPPTVWRWCRKGVKAGGHRVRLRSTRIGGRLYATVEDVERFIAAQNPQVDPTDDPIRDDAKSRRLQAAGLID